MYICECCNFSTLLKTNYNNHLKTNKHIGNVSIKLAEVSPKLAEVSPKLAEISQESSNTFKCKYCDQSYKHKSSLSKHIKYSCTKNKTEDLTELVRLLNLQLEHKDKQIETQSKQIEKLMGKLEINNYTNSNNTINNIVNVNLLNYDQTDISHLTDIDYKKCVNKITNCVKAMIEKIHFDPKKPENMNIYIPSLKDKYFMMYKDNKWILTHNKELETVYEDKEYLIECWIEDKDDETSKKYSKYLKIKDKENELKTIYDDIKLMMFNNKDVVKNIKNG